MTQVKRGIAEHVPDPDLPLLFSQMDDREISGSALPPEDSFTPQFSITTPIDSFVRFSEIHNSGNGVGIDAEHLSVKAFTETFPNEKLETFLETPSISTWSALLTAFSKEWTVFKGTSIHLYRDLPNLMRDGVLYFPETRSSNPTPLKKIVLFETDKGFNLTYDMQFENLWKVLTDFKNLTGSYASIQRSSMLSELLNALASEFGKKVFAGFEIRSLFLKEGRLYLGTDHFDIDISKLLQQAKLYDLHRLLFDEQGYVRTKGIPFDALFPRKAGEGKWEWVKDGEVDLHLKTHINAVYPIVHSDADLIANSFLTRDLVEGFLQALFIRLDGDIKLQFSADLKAGIIHGLSIIMSPDFLSFPYIDSAGRYQDHLAGSPYLSIQGWKVDQGQETFSGNFRDLQDMESSKFDPLKFAVSLLKGSCLDQDSKCARLSVPLHYGNSDWEPVLFADIQGWMKRLDSYEEQGVFLGKPRGHDPKPGENWAFGYNIWFGGSAIQQFFPRVRPNSDFFMEHETNNVPITEEGYRYEEQRVLEKKIKYEAEEQRRKELLALSWPFPGKIKEIESIMPTETFADPEILQTIDEMRLAPLDNELNKLEIAPFAHNKGLASISEGNFYFGAGGLAGSARAILRSFFSHEAFLQSVELHFVTQMAQGEAMKSSEEPKSSEEEEAIFEFMKRRKALADDYYRQLQYMQTPLMENNKYPLMREKYYLKIRKLEEEFKEKYKEYKISFKGVRVPGPWNFVEPPKVGQAKSKQKTPTYLMVFTDGNGEAKQHIHLSTRKEDEKGNPEMRMEAKYEGYLKAVTQEEKSLKVQPISIGGWKIIDPDHIEAYRKQHPRKKIDENEFVGKLIACPVVRDCLSDVFKDRQHRDLTDETIFSWGMADVLQKLKLPPWRFPLMLRDGLIPVALMIEKLANLNVPFFDVNDSHIYGKIKVQGTIHVGQLPKQSANLSVEFPKPATLKMDAELRVDSSGKTNINNGTFGGSVPEAIIQFGENFRMRLQNADLNFKYDNGQLAITVTKDPDGNGAQGQIQIRDHHLFFEDTAFTLRSDEKNSYTLEKMRVKTFEYRNAKMGISIPIQQAEEAIDLNLTFVNSGGGALSLEGSNISLPLENIGVHVQRQDWSVRQQVQTLTVKTRPSERLKLLVGGDTLHISAVDGKKHPLHVEAIDAHLQVSYTLQVPKQKKQFIGELPPFGEKERLDQWVDLRTNFESDMRELKLRKSSERWDLEKIDLGESEFEIWSDRSAAMSIGSRLPLFGLIFLEVSHLGHPRSSSRPTMIGFSDIHVKEGCYQLQSAAIEITGHDAIRNTVDLRANEFFLDLREDIPKLRIEDAEGVVHLGEYTRGWELSAMMMSSSAPVPEDEDEDSCVRGRK